jgi:uncharacterized protein
MISTDVKSCSAFEGFRRIASGTLAQVALKTKKVIDRGERAPVLIFDDASGEQVEIDFRGSADDVLDRLPKPAGEGLIAEAQAETDIAKPRGPGRPRLGVVAHEITLLPRHWEWLGRQPGGASVALRKLVEEARRAHEHTDRIRLAQEAAYRFMSAIAGNLAGFEEATRALFAANRTGFTESTQAWPHDLRDHASKLADVAFAAGQMAPAAAASS